MSVLFAVRPAGTQDIFPRMVAKNQQAGQPAELSWTDAITFCAKLAADELSVGKLPAGLSYSLPKIDEWTDMAKTSALASILAVGDAGLNTAGNAGEWCFTTRGSLRAGAPRVVVIDRGGGELQVDPLKLLDKDLEGPTLRCVLAPPRGKN